MNTQPRRGMRLFSRTHWHRAIRVGMLLLVSPVLNARVVNPVDPPLSKTQQEANRLVAITKPGYYKGLLVPDWRQKQVNTAQAVSAAARLCNQSKAKTGSVVKPLELNGERLNEKQVRLSWEANEDVTGTNFSIERSVNPASGFEPVAGLTGTRMFSSAITYQTIDPNPSTDYTYYRLKRVDWRGASTYSPIIAVKGELPPLVVNAFPNPGQQKTVMFEVSGIDATKPLSVVFHDGQGRILYQHAQVVLDSDGRFCFPNIAGLQPGKYYLRIITTNQQAVTPFILQP